jgi:hypothetical protein
MSQQFIGWSCESSYRQPWRDTRRYDLGEFMRSNQDGHKRRNWLYKLRNQWNEFTGTIFAYIALQETRINREELDKRLSEPRD